MIDITASIITKAAELPVAAITEVVISPLAAVAVVVVVDLLALMTGKFTDLVCLALVSTAAWSLRKTGAIEQVCFVDAKYI